MVWVAGGLGHEFIPDGPACSGGQSSCGDRCHSPSSAGRAFPPRPCGPPLATDQSPLGDQAVWPRLCSRPRIAHEASSFLTRPKPSAGQWRPAHSRWPRQPLGPAPTSPTPLLGSVFTVESRCCPTSYRLVAQFSVLKTASAPWIGSLVPWGQAPLFIQFPFLPPLSPDITWARRVP